jgi:hypothetical protein
VDGYSPWPAVRSIPYRLNEIRCEPEHINITSKYLFLDVNDTIWLFINDC